MSVISAYPLVTETLSRAYAPITPSRDTFCRQPANCVTLGSDRVAAIVLSCSDSTTSNPNEKLPWRERKDKYLEHLRTASQDGSWFRLPTSSIMPERFCPTTGNSGSSYGQGSKPGEKTNSGSTARWSRFWTERRLRNNSLRNWGEW